MQFATLSPLELAFPPYRSPCSFSPRGLVFIHVMKTGGLSVNSMLGCVCSGATTPCALLRHESATPTLRLGPRRGPRYNGSRGDPAAEARAARCASCRRANALPWRHSSGVYCAQVYTTHDSYGIVRSHSAWAQADLITLLREPVERVWSFYRYIRRRYPYFQSHTLFDVLSQWDKTVRILSHLATNATSSGRDAYVDKDTPPHWHWQLSNMMTWQFSSTTARVGFSRQMGKGALECAKKALETMAVVGLSEEMNSFRQALGRRWPHIFGASSCSIPTGSNALNPTSEPPGSASSVLDARTRHKIRVSNQLDLALYEHARKVVTTQ